ncbi:MAG: hypothetical protein WBV95_20165, partial [Desulfobacterales bacterium]
MPHINRFHGTGTADEAAPDKPESEPTYSKKQTKTRWRKTGFGKMDIGGEIRLFSEVGRIQFVSFHQFIKIGTVFAGELGGLADVALREFDQLQ